MLWQPRGLIQTGRHWRRPQTAAGGTFATWNPSDKNADLTLSGGDLIGTQSNGSPGYTGVRATVSKSTGKYYYEVKASSISGLSLGIGNATQSLSSYGGDSLNGVAANNQVALLNNGSLGGIGTAPTADTWLAIAIDIDAELIWFKQAGGDWNNNGANDPATGTGGYSYAAANAGPWFPLCNIYPSGSVLTANFGASAYQIGLPSGFSDWTA